MNELLRRLRALWHRGRLDRELAEEMNSHLELLAEEVGNNAARRQFGNSTLLQETSREIWGWRLLDHVARDLRYGVRTLRRSPGFAVVAVITLALDLGLNMAVFTALQRIVLRPIDYPGAGRLMDVHLILTEERRGTIPMSWSYPKFQELLAWNRSFDALAAFRQMVFTDRGSDDDRFMAEVVSAQYFRMIGLKPELGRVFADEEDKPAGARTVMLISDGYWRRRFGADAGVLGRTLRISGVSFTVVGVLPPGFKGETGRTDVWAPMAAYLMIDPNPGRLSHNLEVIGRLKPGVSYRQADEEVRGIAARMEREHPTSWGGTEKWSGGARPLLEARVDPAVRRSLWILQSATLCVLLIACVNLANLLLGRGAARQREVAIRLAMGTSRGALVRQLLVEPLLLALAGGVAGVFLAAWGLRLAASILPRQGLSFSFEYVRFIDPASLHLESSLGSLGALLALVTGLVFGLLPALVAARADVNTALAGGTKSGGRQQARLRNALVVAQMALAVVLLTGADLTIRSFAALLGTNSGIETRNVLTMNVQPRVRNSAARQEFLEELERRTATLPGVEEAALTNDVPASGVDQGTSLHVEGRAAAVDTGEAEVSPRYFRLFRIPLIAGRVFTENDRMGTPRVVVLSELAARRFFPGVSPVGRHMDFPQANQFQAEVVGVVGDVKYRSPEDADRPVVYASERQSPRGGSLTVRTARNPHGLIPELRRLIHGLDPEARVYDVQTMDEIIGAATWRARLAAGLLGFLAALALTLAAVGIYGVFSYSIAARTRDIGVRIAMGATRASVLGMILRQGAALAAAALLLGIPVARMLARGLRSQLYRVSPADFFAYTSAAVLLMGVVLLACYIPARRATRIDPVEALRHE
jgi:predicted permease